LRAGLAYSSRIAGFKIEELDDLGVHPIGSHRARRTSEEGVHLGQQRLDSLQPLKAQELRKMPAWKIRYNLRYLQVSAHITDANVLFM
jgi:hypothetical protein